MNQTKEPALHFELEGFHSNAVVEHLEALIDQERGPGGILEGVYLGNGQLNTKYLERNAEVLLRAKEYGLARKIFESILVSGQANARALFGIGVCFEKEGQLDKARASYEDSIAYRASFATYRRLASILIRQGRDQYAAEVLERSLHVKDISREERYDVHKACGNCWMRLQNVEKAEEHYKKALDINSAADEIQSNMGSLYLQSGRIEDSKRAFQDAIASNGENEKALVGLGCCLVVQNDYEAAHECFERALEINIQNPTAIFYLVKSAFTLKKYGVAERILSKYIEVAPVNSGLLYSLAGLKFHLGQMKEARAMAMKVLDLSKDHVGAKELVELIDKKGS